MSCGFLAARCPQACLVQQQYGQSGYWQPGKSSVRIIPASAAALTAMGYLIGCLVSCCLMLTLSAASQMLVLVADQCLRVQIVPVANVEARRKVEGGMLCQRTTPSGTKHVLQACEALAELHGLKRSSHPTNSAHLYNSIQSPQQCLHSRLSCGMCSAIIFLYGQPHRIG